MENTPAIINLIDAPELRLIEKSKADQIKATFDPMAEMLYEFEEAYNNIILRAQQEINEEVTHEARRLRIDIGRVRIETEKVRKAQKEEYLRAGKAIDGVSNILKWAVTEKEEKLKEIENYFEIQEKKRLEKLQQDRAAQLSKYVEDAEERDLSHMEDDVWAAYFDSKKKAWEDEQAAMKKAEEERIEKERLNALRVERETKLRNYWNFVPDDHVPFETMDENGWKKFLVCMQKKKYAYDKQQAEIKAEKERLEKEAEKRRLELEKEREEKKRIQREEREMREKLEEELRAKQEAERKAAAEEAARVQSELDKDDIDKVNDLIIDLRELETKYKFKSNSNIEMYKNVVLLLEKVIAYINDKKTNKNQ